MRSTLALYVLLAIVGCSGGDDDPGGQGGMGGSPDGSVASGGQSGAAAGDAGGEGGAAGDMTPVGGAGSGGAGQGGGGASGGDPDAGCTPDEDACEGVACGRVDDGCGERISCGGCEGGELCEDHACIPEGSCEGCAIDGECIGASETDPTDVCSICTPSLSTTEWSPNTGASCGDANPCLYAGACDGAGECVQLPRPSDTLCGEQTACTTSMCDGAGACARIVEGENTPCSDPVNACDLGSTCDDDGACVDRGVLELEATCGENAECTGDADTPECTCEDGFVLDDDGACVDRDECALALDDCDHHPMACDNDVGGYHCACPPEFAGAGAGVEGCTCAHDDWSPSCKPWTSASIQHEHGCAISDGDLYCWGDNEYGQLGLGDRLDRERPMRVGARRDWEQVSAGLKRTCGIAAGEMLCWGGIGWLGTDEGDGYTPARVGAATDWIAVATGLSATCGIREGGALYCWGWNAHGTLGQGNGTPDSNVPLRVLPELSGFSDVALHINTVCAVREGSVYCWGGNTSGLVGDGTVNDRYTPFQVPGLDEVDDVDVHGTSCALRNGAVLCWGGLAGMSVVNIAPSLDDVASMTIGGGQRCATRENGETLCFGLNEHGALGLGDTLYRGAPATLPGSWQALAMGDSTACGIRDGGLYCWGSNAHGARGTGWLDFERVGTASDWTAAGLGYAGGCGLRGTGELHCWGNGVPGTTTGYAPLRIGAESDWSQLSVGEASRCAIRSGELYCWGASAYGALGLGAITLAGAPTRVGMDDDWSAVSVREDHACGIRNGGDLYCWGSNTYGALGTGTGSPDRDTPALVSTGGWQSIAAGIAHSCGVRSGLLHCWGSGQYGALGNGAAGGNPWAPIQIGEGTTWTRAYAGWWTGFAIDASGALYAWGNNSYGELAITGFEPDTTVPARVGTDTGWSALQSTAFHTCGVREGMLYCWGLDEYGEIGQPARPQRWAPQRIGTATTWQDVAVTYDASCAINDGRLYCFGDNEYGKLGSAAGLEPALVLNENDVE